MSHPICEPRAIAFKRRKVHALLTRHVVVIAIGCVAGCHSGSLHVAQHSQSAPHYPCAVSFATNDGGRVYGTEYGGGPHAVVLVHGGRFDKESWARQARVLAQHDLRVLAIDLRGKGRSHGGPDSADRGDGYFLDVLAAVRYVRKTGAEQVSVVGASIGGWAAGGASVLAKPGEIDRIVFLAASSIDEPERLQGQTLFVCTRHDVIGDGDPRLPRVQALYDKAPQPKRMRILKGNAHAQHIFDTEQAGELLQLIIAFLTES